MPGRVIVTLACAICLALGSAGMSHAKSDKAPDPAKAAGAGKSGDAGKSKHGSPDSATAAAAGAILAGVLLSDQDRHTISGYFQHNPLQSQPLPPGIAKNLARGKPLPPGIAKRGLPNALTARLSIPSGYELLSVGTDVLLVALGTRIIADVLRDVAHE